MSQELTGAEEADWRRRAKGVLASPSPNRHGYPDDAPWFFSRGEGQWLHTSRGKVLDLLMARGTSILGYAHPEVADAVAGHAGLGFLTSLRHQAEVEVAEIVVEHVPSAERVLFAKNGSDACTFAVRAARAATGRPTVMSSGFHGFGDVFNAPLYAGNGFPDVPQPHFVPFNVNDAEAFGELVAAHRTELAAIVLDPMNRDLATPDFLALARKAADETGAVLVFDEVVTGFRIHLGGAQTLAGVTPDLTCLGKVMGNGYPLSALCGRADLLAALTRTSFTSTYQTESLGMVVARACLRRIVADDVPAQLAETGERLRRAFDEAAAGAGVSAAAIGPASRLEFVFRDVPGMTASRAQTLFQEQLAAAAVVPTLAAFVSSAFGERELSVATEAFQSAMSAIGTAAAA